MAAKLKAVQEESIPLGRYVSDAVEASDDAPSAIKILESWARENSALFKLLTGPYLFQACQECVGHRYRDKRSTIWNQDSTGKRVLDHANMLLEFPLLDGGSLRHAKKDEVLATAGFYDTQAIDMKFKAVWLRAIAAKLGKKTVEQVFDNSGLRKLQQELK